MQIDKKQLRLDVTAEVDREFNESAGVLSALDLASNAAYKAGYYRQLAISALCMVKIERNAADKLKKIIEELTDINLKNQL